MSDIEEFLPESDRDADDDAGIDLYDSKARAERARRNETVDNMIKRMRLDER